MPEAIKQVLYCILGIVGLSVFAWLLLGLCWAASWADEPMKRMNQERKKGKMNVNTYPSGLAASFANHARGGQICSCKDPVHPGDDENCPVHGKISFFCRSDCSLIKIGGYEIKGGDQLTVRPLGGGGGLLWQLTGARWADEVIAYLPADAVNHLAGYELIKEG